MCGRLIDGAAALLGTIFLWLACTIAVERKNEIQYMLAHGHVKMH